MIIIKILIMRMMIMMMIATIVVMIIIIGFRRQVRIAPGIILYYMTYMSYM
jgi:hypothetical protein